MKNTVELNWLSDEEREILRAKCQEAEVPSDIVELMIAHEARLYGMGRRHGIWEQLKPLVEEGIQREQQERADS